jgi:hypothetical protein
MSPMSDQGLKIVRAALLFGFLGIVASRFGLKKNRAW